MASLIQRGQHYYIQHYVAGKLKRKATGTTSLQIAKEKLRQFESAAFRGDVAQVSTQTPIPEVLERYVNYIRVTKTAKSAQNDVYYLRDAFGPVCSALRITSRKVGPSSRKRPPKEGQDRRRKAPIIDAPSFEEITTAQIADFVSGRVQSRGLSPKTANRYREILCRVFNWAMSEGGVRMRGDKNPAAKVERYRERAPEIRFLTLAQIDEQLSALEAKPTLKAMVATLIYAGLRREELLWLTLDDVDLDNRIIRVRAKTAGDTSWQPKTTKNRAVPISEALSRHLSEFRPRITPGSWYFPSPAGGRWDPDNFSADLRAANQQKHLKWSCLDFRHTFGSQLAMKGESLLKIATLMGNSPEICRRHYAAVHTESLVASVEFPTAEPVVRRAKSA